jgi:multicomponent Na+:H+ antiporter subunit G
MTGRDIAVAVLLGFGIAGFALTSMGLVLSDDVYEQIHYLAPGSLIGAVAIPAAVVVQEGLSQAGAKAILIALLLFLSNPVLSHATARAARIRRKRQLTPRADETFPRVRRME